MKKVVFVALLAVMWAGCAWGATREDIPRTQSVYGTGDGGNRIDKVNVFCTPSGRGGELLCKFESVSLFLKQSPHNLSDFKNAKKKDQQDGIARMEKVCGDLFSESNRDRLENATLDPLAGAHIDGLQKFCKKEIAFEEYMLLVDGIDERTCRIASNIWESKFVKISNDKYESKDFSQTMGCKKAVIQTLLRDPEQPRFWNYRFAAAYVDDGENICKGLSSYVDEYIWKAKETFSLPCDYMKFNMF